MILPIALVAVAYLLGAVPFGLVIAKTFCGVDPRLAGSGNTGTTNVARLCGTGFGLLTLICDAGKGGLMVALAMHLGLSVWWCSAVALAAIVGHMFSFFLHFKGGKGVATTVGTLLPLAFLPLLIAGAACILVIWKTGFVSAGSLTLVGLLPVVCAALGHFEILPLTLTVGLLVAVAHRQNIQRLRRGEEKPWRKPKDPQ